MNIKKINLVFFTAVMILAGFGFADKALAAIPTVATNNADQITSWSARMNGEIIATGEDDNDERGFEWGTAPGVYTSWWTETGSFIAGTFSHSIGSLEPGKTYYYRAKSYNSFGWGYGVEKSFTASSYTYPSYPYTYYASGIATSQNVLESLPVAEILSFDYTATVPAGTTLKAQFSQDGTSWYSSTAVAGGWDTLSGGANSVSLAPLNWNGSNFYYKVEFTSDVAQNITPELADVEISYDVATAPVIVTNDADQITSWSARMNGDITATGGADNDERGFEWGTASGVYTSWWTETGIFTPGTFSHTIGGLDPGQTYYYRAKSHNIIGWSQGAEKSFTTSSYTYPSYPYTYYASGIATSQNVLSGLPVGNIISVDYIATVPSGTALKIQFSQDGVSWYSSTDVAGGWDTLSSGTHNVSLLPLSWNGPNFYYKVNFISNAAQTATPEVDSIAVNHIDTAVNAPTVTTQTVTDIKKTLAMGGGNITDTGGENNNQRGVEWGTASGSYTQETVENGSFGAGAFVTEMTGLIGGQTYYYRAKAHNFSAGWGYGIEKSFITSSHNVFGSAWSDNTGWINFNSSDCDVDGNGFVDIACGGDNSTNTFIVYGVSVDEITGDFSGQAWSDNIGWISFNTADVAGCPSGTCQPNLASDNTVSGWARALSADGLGWDGWIELSDNLGSAYGVTLNPATDEFEGFAWGGDVVGWISFNCVNTASCLTSNHVVTLSFPNTIPSAFILAPNGATTPISPIPINGEFFDTDAGDTFEGFEWRDGSCKTGVPIYSGGPQVGFQTGPSDLSLSDGNHDLYFRVFDGTDWSDCDTFSININPPTECNDGIDNADADLLADALDPGCWTDPADPATYDLTDPSEDGEPECLNSVDDDGDTYIDANDPGCWTDPTDSSTYDLYDNDEDNCGDNICNAGETYPICPGDCPFVWVEF